jgi:uncharacterized pyridoxamine 5'-phosphate oxidase family protein
MQEFIKFANENPTCHLATVDEGQPRVRALGFWYADESGFYFQTASFKDLCGQLKKNPRVEACFFNRDVMKMMRLAGEIEFVDDRDSRQRVMKDRPFLKGMGLNEESPELVMFRIAHGSAHFWTFDTNLKPKSIVKF